jgi:hypothetical protein
MFFIAAEEVQRYRYLNIGNCTDSAISIPWKKRQVHDPMMYHRSQLLSSPQEKPAVRSASPVL